jgi:hypothetical protein
MLCAAAEEIRLFKANIIILSLTLGCNFLPLREEAIVGEGIMAVPTFCITRTISFRIP